MRFYPAAAPAAPWLLLAHGAGAGQDHPWMRATAERLAAAGVSVATFDFPYAAAGRTVPDRAPVLEKAFLDAWEDLAAGRSGSGGTPAPLFAGGKSMGGRIASQVAARLDPAPAGLVFFGYPLHPPGRPANRRDRHLPTIDRPMLFLQGTRDPFGSPDEMQALVARLPQATLSLVDGGDHSLVLSRARAGSGAPDDLIRATADWMRSLARGPR
jgi:predicted alpha/beta-hydrolase family hydrolase